MRVARELILLAALAAVNYAHAADISDLRPTAQPVRNPLEIPPDIVNPVISETGD